MFQYTKTQIQNFYILQNLQYSSTKEPKDTVTVKFGEVNILRALQGYLIHIADKGIDHGDDYKSIDKDDFSRFMSSSDWHEMSKEIFIAKKLKPPCHPITLSPCHNQDQLILRVPDSSLMSLPMTV